MPATFDSTTSGRVPIDTVSPTSSWRAFATVSAIHTPSPGPPATNSMWSSAPVRHASTLSGPVALGAAVLVRFCRPPTTVSIGGPSSSILRVSAVSLWSRKSATSSKIGAYVDSEMAGTLIEVAVICRMAAVEADDRNSGLAAVATPRIIEASSTATRIPGNRTSRNGVRITDRAAPRDGRPCLGAIRGECSSSTSGGSGSSGRENPGREGATRPGARPSADPPGPVGGRIPLATRSAPPVERKLVVHRHLVRPVAAVVHEHPRSPGIQRGEQGPVRRPHGTAQAPGIGSEHPDLSVSGVHGPQDAPLSLEDRLHREQLPIGLPPELSHERRQPRDDPEVVAVVGVDEDPEPVPLV